MLIPILDIDLSNLSCELNPFTTVTNKYNNRFTILTLAKTCSNTQLSLQPTQSPHSCSKNKTSFPSMCSKTTWNQTSPKSNSLSTSNLLTTKFLTQALLRLMPLFNNSMPRPPQNSKIWKKISFPKSKPKSKPLSTLYSTNNFQLSSTKYSKISPNNYKNNNKWTKPYQKCKKNSSTKSPNKTKSTSPNKSPKSKKISIKKSKPPSMTNLTSLILKIWLIQAN